MIGVYPTSKEPMRSFIDRIKAMQGKDGILSISVIHGFMAADVPEMGTRILVVTDNDPDKGTALAEKLGRELISMREQTLLTMFDTDQGIDRALVTHTATPSKPAVIADVWDNPGGGVAGDGTYILRRLIERGVDNIGIATIWDPIAVTFCHAAGEGAMIELPFRRKIRTAWRRTYRCACDGPESPGRRLAEFRAKPRDAWTFGGCAD
jgi:microcystin degradation protein MlrC